MNRVDKILKTKIEFAKKLSNWKDNLNRNWSNITLIADKHDNHLIEHMANTGEVIPIKVKVHLGNLEPTDVKVEILYGIADSNGKIDLPEIIEMKLDSKQKDGSIIYTSEIKIVEGGEYGYTFRIIPDHPDLINRFELGLVKWAVQ
jgi:starch phosphorylase